MTDRHERECELGGVPALCAPCARLRSAYERGVAEGLRRAERERAARLVETAKRFLDRHPDNALARRVLERYEGHADAAENRP